MDYIIDFKENTELLINEDQTHIKKPFGNLLFDLIFTDDEKYYDILKKYNLIDEYKNINNIDFNKFNSIADALNNDIIFTFNCDFVNVYFQLSYKDDYNYFFDDENYIKYRYRDNRVQSKIAAILEATEAKYRIDYHGEDIELDNIVNLKNNEIELLYESIMESNILIDIALLNELDLKDIYDNFDECSYEIFNIIDKTPEKLFEMIGASYIKYKDDIKNKISKYFNLKTEKENLISEFEKKYDKLKRQLYEYKKIKDFIINFYFKLIEIKNKMEILLNDYINDDIFRDDEYLYFLMASGYLDVNEEKYIHLRRNIDEIKEKSNYRYIDELKQIYLREKNDTLMPHYKNIYSSNLLDICFYNIVKQKFDIKTCENCGKYFIPFLRSDTLYCDRISPQDENKTCKEYGSQEAWKKSLENNEALNTCRKLYMQIQMAAKRNKEISKYVKAFENFKIQSKQWKDDVKRGRKTEQEFITWLNEIKRTRGITNGNDT